MESPSRQTKIRLSILLTLILISALSFYFFDNSFIVKTLSRAFTISPLFGYTLFLVFGSLRGFTLLPSTMLIVAGIFFFSPSVLFVLIMTTIFISSTISYFVAQKVHLDSLISEKYRPLVERVRSQLEQRELPIIISLSFLPLFPTDILCYTCGSLNIPYPKFIIGIAIGEGLCCALYIFLGTSILRSFIIL